MLLPEEQLVYSTEVLGGVAKNRAIALTNRRFIMVEDGFRSNYTSIFYSDITDVSTEKRTLGLEIMLRANGVEGHVSFGLRNIDNAAEVCERINMHVRAIRGGAATQSVMQSQAGGYSTEVQLYAAPSREKAYIGMETAKALARRETVAPVVIDEQKARSEIAKAYVGNIGKKGAIVGGRAIILAGGVSSVALSYILKGIKKGMPVLVEKARSSMNGLVVIYSGRKAVKVEGIDLGGYRIAARTGTFSYDFSSGNLNGTAAVGSEERRKKLDQNDLYMFSHRRVREGFGNLN